MRFFVVPARDRALIVTAVEREVNAINGGIIPDSFYTDAELADPRECYVLILSPNEGMLDVLRALRDAQATPSSDSAAA